jgi:cell division transport system permease protein
MKNQEEKYNKRRLINAYISSVVSISLVLFMLGLLGLIIFHAKKISNQVKENIGFSIYMKDSAKEANIIKFQKYLDICPYTKSTQYITKEQAAKELSKDLGEDFMSFLDYNPLPATIDVRLNANYANNDSLKIIEANILKNDIVKEVYYQKNLVQKVNDNIKRISVFILSFSSIFILIAIILVNNTIRLSIYSKRFIIRTMQLVGANSAFIRKPFLQKSILTGFISSIAAIAVLFGVLLLIREHLPEVINMQEIDSYLLVFVAVLILGISFSVVSTYFAVRKYLKIKTDSLY